MILTTADRLEEMTSLALCAGFDMIENPEGEDYVTLYVQQQKGFFATYVPFLHDQVHLGVL